MDFTINTYIELVETLSNKDYGLFTFENFLLVNPKKSIILRHDVDLMPKNSLKFATIQYKMGIAGVYYFRAVPSSWDEQVIREIAGMGHEIGYHYECLTTCKGNLDLAIRDFENNLAALRHLTPVSTICMHGSPLSKYDSRAMWKTYSYHDFGVIGEPYFDLDFSKVAYLTDTGRRWNGEKVSVRDKVATTFTHSFRTTNDIIAAAKQDVLPDQIMFTFHPQRWNDDTFLWTKELISQNVKNIVKQYFFMRK